MEEGLGRYKLLRKVGSGSEGNVWEAEDTKFGGGRRVALKTIELAGKTDVQIDAILARFDQSADIAARLQHRDIVMVLDKGLDPFKNEAYLVMEFVDGVTLRDLLREHPQPPLSQVVAIMCHTLGAIGYCHRAGVVHRDIKPGNLMVETGNFVKVADFGRAHSDSSHLSLTDPDQMIGTPLYMSPEQFTGRVPTGPKSDIWACGVVLYEMLTGRWPFEGENWQIVSNKVQNEKIVPPSRYAPKLPAAMDRIVQRALEKNPDKRFASAEAFAEELAAVLLDSERKGARRSPWPVVAAVAGVAVIGGGGAAAWYLTRPKPPAPKLELAVAPPPAPTPTSAPPAPTFQERVARIGCSALDLQAAGPRDGQHYRIRGLLGEGGPERELDAIRQAFPAVDIQAGWTTFPASAAGCRLIEILRPDLSFNDAPGVKMTITGGEAKVYLHKSFNFDVTMPDFAGFLWVDYLDSEHTISHFELDTKGLPLRYGTGQLLHLPSKGHDYTLDSGPFGRDLVFAIVMSTVPPGSEIPDNGSAAEAGESYATQLQSMIRQVKATGGRVSATVSVVETIGHEAPGGGRR